MHIGVGVTRFLLPKNGRIFRLGEYPDGIAISLITQNRLFENSSPINQEQGPW
jgi:hypothetical protein